MDLLSLVEDGSLSSGGGSVGLPADGVFYLAVPQTTIQRDLVEVLFKLHRQHLLHSLESNVKMELPVGPVLSSRNMFELLVMNMRLTDTHVSLVVKHYMPRKLLLMESHQQIALGSGKFVALDRLLSGLEPLKKTVLVCAQSVKELDLVEGLMLGRKVNYRRFNGTSLYDQESTSKQIIQKKYRSIVHKRSKLQIASKDEVEESLKKSKKKKNTEDNYVSKNSKNHPDSSLLNTDYPCEIFLVLSDQLAQMTGTVDLIVSLDPFLGIDSVSIRSLRTPIGHPSAHSVDESALAPVVKFVTLNSVEHIMLGTTGFESGELLSSVDEQALADLVASIAVNRVNVTTYDEFQTTDLFGGLSKWLVDPLHTEWPSVTELPQFSRIPADKQELADIIRKDLSEDVYKLQHTEYLAGNGSSKKHRTDYTVNDALTYEDYLRHLTTLVLERFERVGELVDKGTKLCETIRLRETAEQLTIEENNEKIGAYYKQLKAAEVKAGALERRVERMDGEHSKYAKTEASLKERLESLKAADPNDAKLAEQESEIVQLETQLGEAETQLETIAREIETLRTSYQEQSTTAASLSQKVKSVEAKRDTLLRETSGLSTSLRKLSLDDAKLSYDEESRILNRTNEFLEAYCAKIEGMVKEKNNLSRGVRVSRSSTPYVA